LSFSIAGLDKGRIEALTDGIFATVMTVLVLSLSIPSITGTNIVLGTYLETLKYLVLSYLLSFLILAVFWVRHHNLFHFIKSVDSPFIWLNILMLLSIGFVPFSTELIGRYSFLQISVDIYGANLIAVTVCIQAIWFYATRRRLVVSEGLDEEMMNKINRRLIGGPFIYIGAIALSYLSGSTEVAIAIYVIALAYYVIASSLSTFTFRPKQISKSSAGT
jgi:uncharacterized membrane protein